MELRMELQAEHICKSYRKKEALKDVNFKLVQGVYGSWVKTAPGKVHA